MNETKLIKPLFKDNTTMAWSIALGSFLCILMRTLSGLVLGVMLKPLSEHFGVPAPQVLLTTTFIAMATLGASTFITPLTKKWSPKYLGVLGGLCISFFFLTMAIGKSIQLVWLGGAFFGISFLLVGPTMNQTLVSNWFKSGVAKLMAWSMGLSAVFVIVLPPLIAKAYLTYGLVSVGWGGCILGLGAALVSFILIPKKLTPAEYGMEAAAFGTDAPDKGKETKEKQDEVYPKLKMPVQRIMKMPVLWIILVANFFVFLGYTGWSSNESLIIMSLGVDVMTMSYVVSFSRISQSVVQFLYGYLADRITPKNAVVIMLSVAFAMHLINFSFKLSGFAAAIVLVLFVRFSHIALFYGATMLPRFFGRESGSFFIGWVQTFSSASSAIAAPVMALIAASSGGSYRAVSLFLAISLLIGVVITLIVYRKGVFDKILEIDKEYTLKGVNYHE